MTGHGVSRRQALRVGWMAAAVSAVAACSSDDEPDAVVAPTPDAVTDAPAEATSDVALLNTALSLEVLIFDTYQLALDLSLVGVDEVIVALRLFQGHHAEHRERLITLVEAAGGDPFTTPNPVVKVALVNPGLASVTREGDFVRLAHDLERASTQLYVFSAAGLSSAELRAAAMSIGGVASRRATVLDLLGELGNERPATYPAENPLPADAIITG